MITVSSHVEKVKGLEELNCLILMLSYKTMWMSKTA